MAALAALADPGSVSQLTGIAHLRGHETDRLAALTHRDQRPRRAVRGDRRRPGDHRDPAARRASGVPTPTTGWRRPARSSDCGSPGVEVEDIGTTAKTLPDFPADVGGHAGRGPGA